MVYHNRQDAGKRLGQSLLHYAHKDVVVLALPRGGVVLGIEVAEMLHAPLGVVLVRKIGHPMYEEYAVGAVVEGEPPLYEQDEVRAIDKQWLKSAEMAARKLLWERHNKYYDNERTQPEIKGKVVILVDDGIATGLTMQAAVQAVCHDNPARVVVAVPVASRESVDTLERMTDEVMVLDNPDNFSGAIGSHYVEFNQVNDEEVTSLLKEAKRHVHQTTTSHA